MIWGYPYFEKSPFTVLWNWNFPAGHTLYIYIYPLCPPKMFGFITTLVDYCLPCKMHRAMGLFLDQATWAFQQRKKSLFADNKEFLLAVLNLPTYMVVPQKSSIYRWIFPYKPSSYGGTPMTMETPICQNEELKETTDEKKGKFSEVLNFFVGHRGVPGRSPHGPSWPLKIQSKQNRFSTWNYRRLENLQSSWQIWLIWQFNIYGYLWTLCPVFFLRCSNVNDWHLIWIYTSRVEWF